MLSQSADPPRKDLNELDHLHWNQDDVYDFEGDHCIIKEGYAALSSRVAATLDIQLNTEVRMIRVDDAQANVEVVVRSGGKTTSMRAGYVVVTLPLGVLKSRLVSNSEQCALNAYQSSSMLDGVSMSASLQSSALYVGGVKMMPVPTYFVGWSCIAPGCMV